MTLDITSSSILAIDAGNSRTKWALFRSADADLPEASGIWSNTGLADAPLPKAWQGCSRAIVSNVAGTEVAGLLLAKLQPLAMEVNWLKSGEFSNGLHNGYAHPRQLGSDRWAAAVAAWSRYRAPCIIANAGTALTVDAIGKEGATEGVFLGGLIVPGFRLMQQSLTQNTAGLLALVGSLQDFPTHTGDAIQSGILNAMAGAVQSIALKLHRREGVKPYCTLSGGDAPRLADALAAQPDCVCAPLVVENLVLQGLLLIERERL